MTPVQRLVTLGSLICLLVSVGNGAPVDVEVINAGGQRCPTALNLIDFSIDGPAEWRGGIAQGPDNYVLANWRTRSYPLRITVDDKTVFTGKAPLSLGYVTLSFPPVTGSNLKIELTADDADDKGTIGIYEIEIYDATSQTNSRQPVNPKLPTIFVVGDSTANNNANGGRGWGDPFIDLFDTTKVNVLNRARAGRSSRTFFTQGLWDNVLSEMKRGDLVLIQFGHNDAGPINDASRARGSLPGTGEETQEIDNLLTKEHEVVHTYGWYLRKMIADTKEKGAIPIILSLTVRNIWKDGHVERGAGKFGQWAAEVAASQKVRFIDVTKLIADKYEQLGEEKVKELFATDHTHTNPAGAELNASLILEGLQSIQSKQVGSLLNHRLHR
jgi:lysophospholipase L1-like esterase